MSSGNERSNGCRVRRNALVNAVFVGLPRKVGFLLLAFMAAASPGGVRIWSGTGADNYWSTAGNWEGGVAPVDNADDLVFAGTARLDITNDLPAEWRFKTLTFATNAGPFALHGNLVRTTASTMNIVNSSPHLQNVALDINTLDKPSIWTAAPGDIVMGGTLTCSIGAAAFNSISASTLTLDGLGTLTLRKPATFTHATPGLKILNGTVVLDMAAGGSLPSSTRLEYGLTASSGGNINKQGGLLLVRGKPAGTSLQELAGLSLYPATSMARIIVDPNGGEGTTLSFGSWWDDRANGGTMVHFDLSRPGASASLQPPLSPTRLIGAWCTVTDTVKTGFATTNAAGRLVRDIPLYEYTWFAAPSTSALATNYYALGGGTLSNIGRLTVLTLQGGGTVTGGSYAYASGLLMEEGVSDFTFAIPSFGFTSATWLHQHSLTGDLIFDCKLNGVFHKAGPGKVIISKDTINKITMNVHEGPVEVRAVMSGNGHHVFNGGTLFGVGSVSSNLTIHAGGRLDGTHAEGKALSIDGHLLLKEDAVVSMTLTNTVFQPLHVAGTATNLGAHLSLDLHYRPRAGEDIDLLACGQMLSGNFKTVNGIKLGESAVFEMEFKDEILKFALVPNDTSLTLHLISRPGSLMMVR